MTTALCITITGSLSAFVAEYKIELLIAFIGFAGTILGAVIQKAKKKISALSQKKLRKLISRKLEQAGSELDKLVGVRTRQIQRRLSAVTKLPEAQAAALLDGEEEEGPAAE